MIGFFNNFVSLVNTKITNTSPIGGSDLFLEAQKMHLRNWIPAQSYQSGLTLQGIYCFHFCMAVVAALQASTP